MAARVILLGRMSVGFSGIRSAHSIETAAAMVQSQCNIFIGSVNADLYPPGATVLENAVAMYDLRFTNYDLLIMCALRKFFESSACTGRFDGSIIIMTACWHDF